MKMKEIFEEIEYRLYTKGIRRLIPTYHDRTIFTKFYWRTWWDRHTKGFDETDTWSLDYTFSKLIAPRLRMFIKYGPGFSIPGILLEEQRNLSIKKGYKFDKNKWQLVDKKERARCWKRAEKKWRTILEEMTIGFEDEILEEQDWDSWMAKWKPVAEKVNKQLDKAETFAEKKKIWDNLQTQWQFTENTRCSPDDVVYHLREHSRELLMKWYNHLWW